MSIEVIPFFETRRICLDLFFKNHEDKRGVAIKTDLSIEETKYLINGLQNALKDMEKFEKDLNEYMDNQVKEEENA